MWRAQSSAGQSVQNAPTPAAEGFPREQSFVKVPVNMCSVLEVVQKLFQWKL